MNGIILGTLAGGLSGTAIYYSFSHSIQDSTRVCRAKLHLLCTELATSDVSSLVGPLPASARVVHSDFTSMLKARWNDDIEGIVTRVRDTRIDVPWRKLWERIQSASSTR